jgi:hypothetical protein
MAKKGKVKVPKRFGGIRIRKRRRKAIQTFVDFIESPEVRGMLGSLTGALATVRAKREANEQPAVH